MRQDEEIESRRSPQRLTKNRKINENNEKKKRWRGGWNDKKGKTKEKERIEKERRE